MGDITNRCVKICRRLEEIEFLLSLNEGRNQTEIDELLDEQEALEQELAALKPAGHE